MGENARKFVEENFSPQIQARCYLKLYEMMLLAEKRRQKKVIMKRYTNQEIRDFVSKPLFEEKVVLKNDPAFRKITVVTPSYNQSEFLERTILSVLNQNYPNLEYIIIDGKSSDASINIIKKYKKYITHWIREKDKGQPDAINKGLNLAKGEILGYLNSDDLYLPGALNKVSELFGKHKDYDLIYGHSYVIDTKEKILNVAIALPFSLKRHLFDIFSVPQSSSFWRREVFEKAKRFNVTNRLCMDWEFYAKCYGLGFKYKDVNGVLSCYRIHPQSITVSKKYAHTFKDVTKIIKKEELGYEPGKLEYIFRHAGNRFKFLPYKFGIRLSLCDWKTLIKFYSRHCFPGLSLLKRR